MSESKAAELAEEITADLPDGLGVHTVRCIESHLQSIFDLLARVHELADTETLGGNALLTAMCEIEELTRPYDCSQEASE